MSRQTSIRSILSSFELVELGSSASLLSYFARHFGSSLSVAWLSDLGGPASVASATALASTLICLWLTHVCRYGASFLDPVALPVAWLSALGGPASVAGATALVSADVCRYGASFSVEGWSLFASSGLSTSGQLILTIR
jgi:hypothetical protein